MLELYFFVAMIPWNVIVRVVTPIATTFAGRILNVSNMFGLSNSDQAFVTIDLNDISLQFK